MGERKPLVQWTILEFIGVVTVGTLVVGAMWASTPVFTFCLFVSMVLVLGMGTIALTGRGEWRLFATGFTMVVLAYTALGMLGFASRLPTHDFWRYLQPSLTRAEYREDPPPSLTDPVIYQSGSIYDETGKRLGSIHGISRRIEITPSNRVYTQTGHVFWTLLGAYVAGKFAVSFCRYQNHQHSTTSATKHPLPSSSQREIP